VLGNDFRVCGSTACLADLRDALDGAAELVPNAADAGAAGATVGADAVGADAAAEPEPVASA